MDRIFRLKRVVILAILFSFKHEMVSGFYNSGVSFHEHHLVDQTFLKGGHVKIRYHDQIYRIKLV